MNNTKYSLECEGKRDSKYGGIITDINKLPVGTEFYVCNGAWRGIIRQGNVGTHINCKYIDLGNNNVYILQENKPYLLAIVEDYVNSINDNSNESPCNNCMESYCYKNCDKYTEWQNKAETIMKAYSVSKFDKFLIAKEILIEFKSGFGTHKERRIYRCPNCKQILSKTLCESKDKISHCYKCGQVLMFKGDK